jgi:SAM-dependent methyltransferase
LRAEASSANGYRPHVAEPALWGLRRRLLDAGDRLNLARPAVRAYELALATRASLRRSQRTNGAGGLPLPPARLRAQAGPKHADPDYFLRSGERHAELIRDLLAEDGAAIDELEAILDWGCGCGRILRHWVALDDTRVHGCDINPRMAAWCTANLPFAKVTVNDISPPLPYPDASLDLVYALSVLTHLPEELQHAWVGECRRILKPGGRLLFSTMGEHYLTLQRLTESERRSFEAGNLVVLYEGAPGTSLCSAYHPPAYVRERLAAGFDRIAFRPAAEDGRHDLHLLRKPS